MDQIIKLLIYLFQLLLFHNFFGLMDNLKDARLCNRNLRHFLFILFFFYNFIEMWISKIQDYHRLQVLFFTRFLLIPPMFELTNQRNSFRRSLCDNILCQQLKETFCIKAWEFGSNRSSQYLISIIQYCLSMIIKSPVLTTFHYMMKALTLLKKSPY